MNRAETDIGTIIYIALAILAAVASLFKKKNNAGDDTPDDSPHIPQPHWEDEYDLPRGRDVYEPEIQPVTIEVVDKKQAMYLSKAREILDTVPEQKLAFGMEGMLGQSVGRLDYDPIKDSEIGSKPGESGPELKGFKLREAIIYAEILNRKY